MNISLIGGGGAVGRYLVKHYLAQDHYVKVLDPNPGHLDIACSNLELIRASTNERDTLREILQDTDVIINCAWSFSDLAAEVFAKDIGGLICLLEEVAKRRPKLFCNMSSAIVYGVPKAKTIEEEHPCLIEQARKPVYALGKLTAEKLCALYAKENNFPAVNIRFWWGFADEIGGKHLKAMIKAASEGHNLEVPAGAGGSFLHFADLASTLDRLIEKDIARGDVYNLASFYITWEEIAYMIKDIVNKHIEVIAVPGELWRGKSFLADRWELSTNKAKEKLGFTETFSPEEYRSLLEQAIKCCAMKI